MVGLECSSSSITKVHAGSRLLSVAAGPPVPVAAGLWAAGLVSRPDYYHRRPLAFRFVMMCVSDFVLLLYKHHTPGHAFKRYSRMGLVPACFLFCSLPRPERVRGRFVC